MRQMYQKYLKSVGKLIVCKFTDVFMSLLVIINRFLMNSESVDNYSKIHQ